MKAIIFQNKKNNDYHYAHFNDSLISVYLPDDYTPKYKTAKNGNKYFIADVELYKSMKNNKYSFIVVVKSDADK